jgi:uncharacterized membrane protein HdeD (DUF308 family)
MEHVTSGYRRMGYEELQIPWWIVLLEGIISIILGLFLIFEPVATTITLVQILGIFWFLGGVFTILSLLVDRENIGWKLLSGLVGIVTGLIVFVYPYSPFVVLAFFVVIMGVLSIVYGAVRFVWAFKGGGLGTAVLGILTITLGVLLLANPLAGAVVLPWIYGFFLVIGGVAALIWGILARSGR